MEPDLGWIQASVREQAHTRCESIAAGTITNGEFSAGALQERVPSANERADISYQWIVNGSNVNLSLCH